MASEDALSRKLQDLQKQLGKKNMFEEAVSSIKYFLIEIYPSASSSLRKLIYSVVCRVSTVLQTRYTAPGFWLAGLGLFEEAERLVSEPSEREHLKNCIARAREQLNEEQNCSQVSESPESSRSRGYLFDGHLTVDPEPPQPSWLVTQNILATLIATSSQERNENNVVSEGNTELLQQLMDNLVNLDNVVFEDINSVSLRRPPASKDVVSKLPVITVTEEILRKLGQTSCCICQENLAVDDKMQELPCKHIFHPPCLSPWLEKHNSCPTCRYELQTDDHAYESWKEREKEAAEERKGAANALRGGEYIFNDPGHEIWKILSSILKISCVDHIGNLVLQKIWNFLHLMISIWYFLLGIVCTLDSHLISSGLLRKYRSLDLRNLRCLAIVIDSEEAHDIPRVVELIHWLSVIGVKHVSLYDRDGILKESKRIILKKLTNTVPWKEFGDKGFSSDEKQRTLEFVSFSEAKEGVVKAANFLSSKYLDVASSGGDPESIFTETNLTKALTAVGCGGLQPDLLLIYGPARCHLGFPAWRMRYTEIVNMGPLKSMKRGSLIKSIHKFSMVHQNYGS